LIICDLIQTTIIYLQLLFFSFERKQQSSTLQLHYSFIEKAKEDRDGVLVIILRKASHKLWLKKYQKHQLGLNNKLKPLIFFSWDYVNL
jgi:hypothetical protein